MEGVEIGDVPEGLAGRMRAWERWEGGEEEMGELGEVLGRELERRGVALEKGVRIADGLIADWGCRRSKVAIYVEGEGSYWWGESGGDLRPEAESRKALSEGHGYYVVNVPWHVVGQQRWEEADVWIVGKEELEAECKAWMDAVAGVVKQKR
jgi:hypothetical protein